MVSNSFRLPATSFCADFNLSSSMSTSCLVPSSSVTYFVLDIVVRPARQSKTLISFTPLFVFGFKNVNHSIVHRPAYERHVSSSCTVRDYHTRTSNAEVLGLSLGLSQGADLKIELYSHEQAISHCLDVLRTCQRAVVCSSDGIGSATYSNTARLGNNRGGTGEQMDVQHRL